MPQEDRAGRELGILEKHLRNASNFFEFGTGASTVHLASKFPHLKIQAVELDEHWAGRVNAHLKHLSASATVRHVDIGATEVFGFPEENLSTCIRQGRHVAKVCDGRCLEHCGYSVPVAVTKTSWRGQWPSFSDQILHMPPGDPGFWQVILVDSRFRVACALKAFLHLHLAGKAGAAGSDKGRVLVHDWAESRMQKYKEIQNFGQIQLRIANMAVFRARPLQRLDELRAAIRRFEYNPA